MPKGLKLLATNAEELGIVSAALEGTITTPGEMSFLRQKRVFTVMGSRFMWEEDDSKIAGSGNGLRIRSGILFSDVRNVRSIGVSQEFQREALELLSISYAEKDPPAAELHLQFAGGGVVQLDVECINVALTDTGEGWPTSHKPLHED
jgi:Protein of unknown function (DUF2948)